MNVNPKTADTLRRALPTSEAREIKVRDVQFGFGTHVILFLMRWFLRPWLARALRGSPERIAKIQIQMASRLCKNSSGLPLDYDIVGKVPGHVLGRLTDTHKPAILWLHGGAFILPAVPEVHVHIVSKMCRDLDAVGFLPDYRLTPFNKFPAALDDCENAYRALLDVGFSADRIVLAGESAGGNLVLGVLQRIRKAELPMPACAIPVSPAGDMARTHAPPSRVLRASRDPILPITALSPVAEMYVGDWDASDPEVSPLFADFKGFPPLFLLGSDNEILLDETVLMARRAIAAGVPTRLDIWPLLPHAFPLFERIFPKAKLARQDMVAFMREHIRPGA